MNAFVKTDDEAEALSALTNMGRHSVPVIKSFLWKEGCEGLKCRKLISALGKMK